MTKAFLITGILSFILSFFVHRFFIQFVVLAVFLVVLYILNTSKEEIDSLKKSISEHNDLLKRNLDELDNHEITNNN